MIKWELDGGLGAMRDVGYRTQAPMEKFIHDYTKATEARFEVTLC